MSHRRLPALLFSIMLMLSLLTSQSLATGEQLAFQDMPEVLRPGKTVRISFTAPTPGTVSIALESADGHVAAVLSEQLEAQAGYNSIFWDGQGNADTPVSPGSYKLRLRKGDDQAEAPLQIGAISPQLSGVRISDPTLLPDKDWSISAAANMPGTLRLMLLAEGQNKEILHERVPSGALIIPWNGVVQGQQVAGGQHTLSLMLTDEEGFTSNLYQVLVQVEAPATTQQPQGDPHSPDQHAAQPAPQATKPPDQMPTKEEIAQEKVGTNYWTLPVGEWNEDKIWEIMMQPLTVLKGRDQRETYKLRKTPDKDNKRDNIVGEITYVSQGVHVLETRDDGWSLVEAFNSSYGPDNRSRRGYGDTDDLIRGYVETSVLETITPRTDFGVLIDKLKQEMYIFKDGKLFTTLIISTGLPTRQQPWNETPSGEFLMVSRVGDFPAGNMTCAMGMRINGGSLIHEVPYLTNATTGYKDYSFSERVLGEKASHGCIRVQRKNNDDGVNMTWVWNNIKVNTKVLVWDDSPGRFYEHPADDLMLYFNPTGGKFYHADQNCSSIRDRYLPLKGAFTYAELDNAEHAAFTACRTCNPPPRRAEIDELNRANGF